MTTNPMADAIKPGPEPPTREVPWPHFYSDLHRQQREQEKHRRDLAGMSRQDLLNNGYITVQDLDDEELRVGRCRDRAGRIPPVSNKTALLPRDLYDEMVAEHLKRTHEKFRQQLDVALNTMVDIMTDESVEPKDRADAAKYLMERTIGKPVERVAVHAQKEPWEEIAMDVGRTTRAEHERRKREALDVEVVDETQSAPTYAAIDPSPVPRDHGIQAAEATAVRTTGPVDDPHGTTAHVEAQVDSTGQPRPEAPSEPEFVEYDPVGSVVQTGWEHPTFAPHQAAPSLTNPAHSSSTGTLSEELRAAQDRAFAVAERRAERKSLVESAKKRRKARRALGVDVVRKGVPAVEFEAAQNRLLDAIDNTSDESGEPQAEPGTLEGSGHSD